MVPGDIGLEILAPGGPLTCAHCPVPGEGVLAAIVAVVPQMVWLGPAVATGGV